MDLVRAQDVTDLLIASRDEPWFDTWYDSLPIAGNPDRFTGGTLRSRMRNTPAADNLHGKTGSLTGVTALSGYVSNADGRELVFAMISNNYISSPRSIEDALGVTLASWSEGGAGEEETVQRFGTRELRPSGGYGPDGVECSWVKAC
jgi:D-alanyl-D-alanine carboxypeptidase/D-alanyl-D-alanine-endopeptidase (penicillin-binding protein 4)